jgi:hypothetical protein
VEHCPATVPKLQLFLTFIISFYNARTIRRVKFKKHWQYAYFNECMTGFEWQVAAHMVQEGASIKATDLEETAALLDHSDKGKSLTARG